MLLKWTGSEYPNLKIALRGKFALGSDLYLFQRIKQGRCAKFHAGVTICMINVIRGENYFIVFSLSFYNLPYGLSLPCYCYR